MSEGADGDGNEDAEADEGSERPSDTMRERVPESSRKFWLLLDADRTLVAGGIVGAVFLALVVVGQFHPIPTPTLFAQEDPLETLFQGLLGSIITGVTLVLTLSQLVLSQEQGPVGDQRERMEGAMSFRKDVEDVIEEPVSPAQPSAFLRSLVKLTQRRAEALSEAIEDVEDAGLNEQVETFLDNLRENAESVQRNLEGSQFGEFDVVFSALNYNYSWKLYAARRIRAENEDVLTDEARGAFDELVDALELFGPAREHFKTLYFQWALIDLSRTMLYASIPALATAVTGILYLEPSLFPGTVLGVRTLVVVVSAAVAVSLLPFAFLLSYILRIVTVTKRTLSIGPFILRETDRSQSFDWGETEAAGEGGSGGNGNENGSGG
ncbi:hypothetical protein [Halospeciosus flavus]|uniref:Uncharacterized protein n=1 Tax=Halospeciosus flavus TaxID=3032283 RepID=A0ABD5Z8U2_9EURY